MNCVASSCVSEWTTVGDEPSFLAVKIAACAAKKMVSLQCGQTTVASMGTRLANRKVNKRIVDGNARGDHPTNMFSAGSPAKRSGAADCPCT